MCLLSHISPMERLFVLKTLSRTQRATKVKIFVGFSLKPLRCRDPALPPLYGHAQSAIFPCVFLVYAHAYFSCIYAYDTPPRVQHFSAFHCCFACECSILPPKCADLHRKSFGSTRCQHTIMLTEPTKDCHWEVH